MRVIIRHVHGDVSGQCQLELSLLYDSYPWVQECGEILLKRRLFNFVSGIFYQTRIVVLYLNIYVKQTVGICVRAFQSSTD